MVAAVAALLGLNKMYHVGYGYVPEFATTRRYSLSALPPPNTNSILLLTMENNEALFQEVRNNGQWFGSSSIL